MAFSEEEKAELQKMMDASTEKAVSNTLKSLGIDTNEAIEAQKDFAFLRTQRSSADAIVQRIKQMVVIGIIAVVIYFGNPQLAKFLKIGV